MLALQYCKTLATTYLITVLSNVPGFVSFQVCYMSVVVYAPALALGQSKC